MEEPEKREPKFCCAVDRLASGTKISSKGPPITPPKRRRVSGEEEEPTPISAPAIPERITITKISILPTPRTLMIRKPSL